MSPPPEADHVRWEVVFRGHVQGVGFRWTTAHLAADYHVTGYVKNMPDGSVRLVAEGPRGEVEAFVAAVRRRMQQYIRSVDQSEGPARGEFTSFEIRH